MMLSKIMITASLAVAFVAGQSRAATLFDFEEGAFGTNWFNLSTGADLSPDLGFSNSGEALLSGTLSLGPVPHGERDQAHDTLHVRSIPFFLDGSGDLTFLAKGGRDGIAPNLGIGPIAGNVQGVALTRDSDGERVLSSEINFQSTPNTITWSQATLQPFANEVGETWTLDVYDTFVGGWGWFSVDDFNVPGTVVPEPSSFVLVGLGLAGLLLVRSRR